MGAVQSISRIFSADVLARVLSFVVLAYLARQLAPEDLALLPIYELMVALGPALFGFGLLVAVIRTYPSVSAEDPPRARGIALSSALMASVGVAVYALIVSQSVGFVQKLIPAVGVQETRLFAAGCFIFGVGMIAEYLIWARGGFAQLARIKVIRGVIGSALIVLFHHLYGLQGVIIAYVVREGVVTCAALVFAIRGFGFHEGVQWAAPVELVKGAFPYWLESLLLYLRNYSDNWIIGGLVGPAALSVYYVAKRFYWLINILLDAIDKVVTFRLSELRNSDSELERALGRLQRTYVSALIPLLLVYLAALPVGLVLLGGGQYRAGLVIALLLCTSALIEVFFKGYLRTAFVRFSAVARLRITAFETMVLLPGLALGGMLGGSVGVALARVVAVFASGSYARILVRRVIRPRYWQQGLGRLLSVTAGGVCLSLALQYWFPNPWLALPFLGISVLAPAVFWPWWSTEGVRSTYREIGIAGWVARATGQRGAA